MYSLMNAVILTDQLFQDVINLLNNDHSLASRGLRPSSIIVC